MTDDHEIQERLWLGAATSLQRNPSNLRVAITREEVDARNSSLASFVTVVAYEAAGRCVRQNLFSAETDAVYLGDPERFCRDNEIGHNLRMKNPPETPLKKQRISRKTLLLKRLHFPLDVILRCVRWYVAYPLRLRDLEEIIAALCG